jgi:hypothetical protein
VLDATSRFHNPGHAAAWSEPGIDAEYEASGRSSYAGSNESGRADAPDREICAILTRLSP